MAIWQRSKDHDHTETDDRLGASRDAFVAEHDATFDFEAGWADIVARADATTAPTMAPDQFERRPDAERDDDAFPVVVDPERRPGRRKVLVGAGSIAAAAAIAAVLVVTGPDGANGDDELTTRIVTATRSALADSVEHEVTDWSDTSTTVDDEAWRDQTTAAVRFLHFAPDGSGRSLDVGPVESPTPNDAGPTTGPYPLLSVDYCFEEWDVQDLPIPEGSSLNTSIARAVADGLDEGSMVTDGTEVIDGQELVRVVEADPTSDLVWYVDPDSYRPVRVVGGDEGHDYITTIEYLPRTPELLAAFTPVIPEGFAEVDPLTRTDDHRSCS